MSLAIINEKESSSCHFQCGSFEETTVYFIQYISYTVNFNSYVNILRDFFHVLKINFISLF